MRGQLELNFQLIFVLIAGIAFLGLFFVGIRSCARSGNEQAQTLDLKYAASALSAASWNPQSRNSNAVVTMRQLAVSCPEGTLTIATTETDRAARASLSVDGGTIFLPPIIDTRSQAVTRELTLVGDVATGVPSVYLGNALFVVDRNTYYFFVNSDQMYQTAKELLGEQAMKNMQTVGYGELISGLNAVPATATSIIVVTGDSALGKVEGYKEDVPVYLVEFQGENNARFSLLNEGLSNSGTIAQYHDDLFAIGALISGQYDVYSCAKSRSVERMRAVTSVSAARIDYLLSTADESCTQKLSKAKTVLDEVNKISGNDAYLRALYDPNKLLASQQVLYRSECQVIA